MGCAVSAPPASAVSAASAELGASAACTAQHRPHQWQTSNGPGLTEVAFARFSRCRHASQRSTSLSLQDWKNCGGIRMQAHARAVRDCMWQCPSHFRGGMQRSSCISPKPFCMTWPTWPTLQDWNDCAAKRRKARTARETLPSRLRELRLMQVAAVAPITRAVGLPFMTGRTAVHMPWLRGPPCMAGRAAPDTGMGLPFMTGRTAVRMHMHALAAGPPLHDCKGCMHGQNDCDVHACMHVHALASTAALLHARMRGAVPEAVRPWSPARAA